ncbi:hypothetical protein RRG08_044230 [Elysia crispata]|uniref:Uncharacterized protein n=1 Tax=Elysia crispata TaxID=231223 RepID=A0AAE0XWR8_9GAST|nr:hypothetical protein RRG08_044230 [Elysia crispata]
MFRDVDLIDLERFETLWSQNQASARGRHKRDTQSPYSSAPASAPVPTQHHHDVMISRFPLLSDSPTRESEGSEQDWSETPEREINAWSFTLHRNTSIDLLGSGNPKQRVKQTEQ